MALGGGGIWGGRIRGGVGYHTWTGTHKREFQKHHVSGALILFFCRKYCHMSPSHNVTVRRTDDYRTRCQFCSVSRPILCSHLTHFFPSSACKRSYDVFLSVPPCRHFSACLDQCAGVAKRGSVRVRKNEYSSARAVFLE